MKIGFLTATALICLPDAVVAFHPSATPHSFRSSSQTLNSEASGDLPDFEGKTIYQRTFYRLAPGSQVAKPNALVLEERLRFQSDPERPGYILPIGPRTYIFREGTSEDEITDALYRFDLGSGTNPHNGPGTMDTDIATALWMASNPHLIQGDVLQLGCEAGAAGVLGCMAAKLALNPQVVKQEVESSSPEVLTVPKDEKVFPDRMHFLTLSDEGEDSLRAASETVQPLGNSKITLKDVRWSTRLPPGRRYDHYYRTIVGSDIDFSYPSSKELARTVANCLLPSNELAVISTKDGASTSSSFGGFGMEMEDSTPQIPNEKPVDSSIPPAFVHVAPETREDLRYLKQFLEMGFKMTVDMGYINLERLNFVFQSMEQGTAEAELENLDTLELKDDTTRSYQFIKAVHHPNYAGDGSGEYFFPLETGEYEGGSRSTWLEPEEGGSPW
jgi:hypothetical protein